MPRDPHTGTATPTRSDCKAIRHCSARAYTAWGCECPEAYAALQAKYRRRVKQGGLSRSLPRPRHRDIDEVAVERAMKGEPVPLTVPERGVVVDRLTRKGLSCKEIAKRLGIAERSVTRYRTGQIQSAREVA